MDQSFYIVGLGVVGLAPIIHESRVGGAIYGWRIIYMLLCCNASIAFYA